MGVFIRQRREQCLSKRKDTGTHRGGGRGKTEAEAGGMRPQAKDAWNPQEPEEAGRILPSSPEREHGPADTLISDFWPLEL